MIETEEKLSELGEAALDYARRGWKVFPLVPQGKTPVTAHGLHDATTDESQIRSWWGDNNPNFNIGFATGDGVQVVDVDGQTGEDSLLLMRGFQDVPDTLTAFTGHGRHFFYKYPDTLGNSASRIAEKIDTRGDGGYVVLAPSVHENGMKYRWADGQYLAGEFMAELPPWISEELKPKDFTRWSQTARTNLADDEFILLDTTSKYDPHPENGSYVAGDSMMHPYIASFLPDKWNDLARTSEGSRNQDFNALAFLAGRIVRGGVGNASFLQQNICDAALAAGLTPKEVDKTWRSGFEAGWSSEPFVIEELYGDRNPLKDNSKNSTLYNRHKKDRADRHTPDKGSIVLTRASDVRHQHVDFLWGNRLVQNAINVLGGDGGIGKSAISLMLAGSVTDGIRLPDDIDHEGNPQTVDGDVIFITYEDTPALIKQRAGVIGIDLDKLYILEGWKDEHNRVMPFDQEHVDDLNLLLEDLPDVRLLIVDPWARYLDDDDNKDKLIRRAMAPLERLAKERNVTVVLVCHTNKSADHKTALGKLAGHSALKNVARSVLMIGEVSNETLGVGHAKHNLSRQALTIEYTWDDDKNWSAGENPMEWGVTTKMDPDELFQAKVRTKTADALKWLRSELEHGPVEINEIKALADEAGFRAQTLETARKALGVVTEQSGNQFSGKETMWRLP